MLVNVAEDLFIGCCCCNVTLKPLIYINISCWIQHFYIKMKASPDTERSEDRSLNSALHTEYGVEEDYNYDPYIEMPESSSVDDQSLTTDSSHTVSCTVSIALAILRGMMVLFLSDIKVEVHPKMNMSSPCSHT